MKINQSECSIRRFISIQVPRSNQSKTNNSEVLDPTRPAKIRQNRD